MDSRVRAYLSRIGQRGGRKSRRILEPETARQMVKLREARRLFAKYHARCFWSYSPEQIIEPEDIAWVGEQLMKYGDRLAWLKGYQLCH